MSHDDGTKLVQNQPTIKLPHDPTIPDGGTKVPDDGTNKTNQNNQTQVEPTHNPSGREPLFKWNETKVPDGGAKETNQNN